MCSKYGKGDDQPAPGDWMKQSFSVLHNNQGVELMFQDNFRAAQEEFELAHQMDPQMIRCQINLAICKILEGELETGFKVLNDLDQAFPSHETIRLNLGVYYLWNSDYEKAASHFEWVLKQTPHHQLAHLNLGDVYFKQGRIQEAYSHWNKANQPDLFFLVHRRLLYLQPSLGFTDWFRAFVLKIPEPLADV